MTYLSQCKTLNISIIIKGFWISQLIENDVYVQSTSFGILVSSYFSNKNLVLIDQNCLPYKISALNLKPFYHPLLQNEIQQT